MLRGLTLFARTATYIQSPWVKVFSDEHPDFEFELAAICAQRFDEYRRGSMSTAEIKARIEAMYTDRGTRMPKDTGTKS